MALLKPSSSPFPERAVATGAPPGASHPARLRHPMPSTGGRRPALRTPDALLYAVALMTATYVWRIQDLFPVLGSMKINLLAAVASFGLVLMDRDPARRVARVRTPIVICALSLIALSILGLPTSLWPRNSAMFLLTGLVPNVVLMILVAMSVRGMNDLRWLAIVNVIGACLYSLFVLVTFDGGAGRLGNLIYYDSNDLALVLVCTIPFAILLLVGGGRTHHLLALGSLLLITTTLVKTGSRGGFLGLVAVVAYLLVAFRAIPRRVRILAVAGAFAGISVLAGEEYWSSIRSLGDPAQDYNWSGMSTEGRMEVWKRGLGYLAAHPVLGVGLRNFTIAEGTLSEESRSRAERGSGFKWSTAHNSFLEVAVELGVLGLACFIGMFASAIRALGRIKSPTSRPHASRQSTSSPRPEPVSIAAVAVASALTASLVGFIVCGFFVSAAYLSFLYVVLGMTIGLVKVGRATHLHPTRLARPMVPAPVPTRIPRSIRAGRR